MIEGALIVDLIHPFLTWSDPAKAIKQNINVLFCFLIALIHAALLTGISFAADARRTLGTDYFVQSCSCFPFVGFFTCQTVSQIVSGIHPILRK